MPEQPPDDPPTPTTPPLISADDTTVDLRADSLADRTRTEATFHGGEIFGSYRIERLLGRGGMGEVYEAEQLETGHRVALKLLSPALLRSETQRRRFLREGRLAAAVRHPHSLYVYGTEEIDGCPVIAMELARRGTLRDLVEREGPLSPAQIARFGIQLVAGLSAAVEAGVLHRDIKPANCFVDDEGKVKIGDYGLSLPSEPEGEGDLTVTGDFLGTPAFASPEQVRGEKLDLRSDLYSLGATLYYLATGRPPFSASRGAKLLADVLTARPESPHSVRREVPKSLNRVILRCLEKDRARRFQAYTQLDQALSEFAVEPSAPQSEWQRIAAGLADGFLISLIIGFGPPTNSGELRTVGWMLASNMTSTVYSLAYGLLFESVWSRTPGKALLGLRLVPTSGGSGRLAGVIRRNLLFNAPGLALIGATPLLLSHGTAALSPVDAREQLLLLALPGLLWFLFLFSRPRAANGWSAWHDTWSGTRVAQSRSTADPSAVLPTTESESKPAGESGLGPYVIASPIEASASRVIEGYDRALRRRVWIVPCSAQTPHVALRRRDLDHVGRPRWVHGRRGPEEAWDAYELEPGETFLEAVASPRAWTEVRVWLLDLARTVVESAADSALRTPIELDRLWVTQRAKLLLLDFVPPNSGSIACGISDIDQDPSTLARFLWEVARRALDLPFGSAEPASGDPLPRHASRLLHHLREGAFASREALVDALVEAQGRRAVLSRRLRLTQAVTGLCMPLFVGVVLTTGEWNAGRRHPEQVEVGRALDLHRKLELRPTGANRAEDLRMVELYLAGPLRVAASDSSGLAEPSIRMSRSDLDRSELESLLRSHPVPDPESLRAAIAAYPRLARHELALTERLEPLAVARAGLVGIGLIACFGLPCALIFAFWFRGGVGYRLLGLVLVNSRGEEVSRTRAALRALVGAIPLAIALWLGLSGLDHSSTAANDRWLFTSPWMALAGLLCLGAIAWAVVDRHRIFQDHICRTHVTVE